MTDVSLNDGSTEDSRLAGPSAACATPPRLALWRKVLAVIVGIITLVGFYLLSAGTVVLNGTGSLPHNGYIMIQWPHYPWRGSYVAFDAPEVVAPRYRNLSFIKRVVGMPGDEIVWHGTSVCVAQVCREPLPSLTAQGFAPLPRSIVPDKSYVVFGDAPDSLDSRYAVIGLVTLDRITAVGVPAPIPHWTEVQTWFE